MSNTITSNVSWQQWFSYVLNSVYDVMEFTGQCSSFCMNYGADDVSFGDENLDVVVIKKEFN
jgi:hypothetical protein